jgi:hypothetical protein
LNLQKKKVNIHQSVGGEDIKSYGSAENFGFVSSDDEEEKKIGLY